MMQLLIISIGALFLVLTNSAEAAKLGSIESSIERLNPLETRQESLKGCSMSSLDKCYGTVPPDGSVPNDLLEEIGHISDAQTCQRFCNELYNGTCQWFMYDKTTEDCKLFSSSLNDLWNDCREVGYAREPNHELCDEMFPSDSSNGCYNFREDYCRFEFSLLENLEEIDSLSECQLACQYINNCSYFVYDSPSKICKLNTQLSQKTCDIIHGTPQPDLNTCLSGGKIDWASNSVQPSATTERPDTTSSQTAINGTNLPTTTLTSQACPNDWNPNDCFSHCLEKYGGRLLRGNTYICQKGCAFMKADQVQDANTYCCLRDFETCKANCRRWTSYPEKCDYGCTFWNENPTIPATCGSV